MRSTHTTFISTSRSQTTIASDQDGRFKVTTEQASDTSETIQHDALVRNRLSPIWQLTAPICLVLMTAIISLATCTTDEGKYVLDFVMSRDYIRLRTEVDKRTTDFVGRHDL